MSQEKEDVRKAYIEMQNAMIKKDMKKLNEIVKDDKKFVHMGGKTQTKEEFFEEIKNGTLNYFNSILKDEIITVTGNKANIKGKTTLKAKVYGIEGEWTLPTDANFEKINGKWVFCN
jgi:hypothetical protein